MTCCEVDVSVSFHVGLIHQAHRGDFDSWMDQYSCFDCYKVVECCRDWHLAVVAGRDCSVDLVAVEIVVAGKVVVVADVLVSSFAVVAVAAGEEGEASPPFYPQHQHYCYFVV